MAKLMKCPDCGSMVSKQAVSCPSCGRPFKRVAQKSGGCLSGCSTLILIGLGTVFGLYMLTSNNAPRQSAPSDPSRQVGSAQPSLTTTSILPEITAFLREHSEFGTPGNVVETANWAEGKRQIITFDTGKMLEFYEAQGKITTVWETGRGKKREIVWGKPYEPEDFTPVAKPAADNLPAYKLLFVGQQRLGGRPNGLKFGEALIPSLSRKTPAAERERIARGIATAEGVDDLTIYSTEEAQKANVSESFSKAHPGALKKGFLGSLREGKFTAGEETFP